MQIAKIEEGQAGGYEKSFQNNKEKAVDALSAYGFTKSAAERSIADYRNFNKLPSLNKINFLIALNPRAYPDFEENVRLGLPKAIQSESTIPMGRDIISFDWDNNIKQAFIIDQSIKYSQDVVYNDQMVLRNTEELENKHGKSLLNFNNEDMRELIVKEVNAASTMEAFNRLTLVYRSLKDFWDEKMPVERKNDFWPNYAEFRNPIAKFYTKDMLTVMGIKNIKNPELITREQLQSICDMHESSQSAAGALLIFFGISTEEFNGVPEVALVRSDGVKMGPDGVPYIETPWRETVKRVTIDFDAYQTFLQAKEQKEVINNDRLIDRVFLLDNTQQLLRAYDSDSVYIKLGTVRRRILTMSEMDGRKEVFAGGFNTRSLLNAGRFYFMQQEVDKGKTARGAAKVVTKRFNMNSTSAEDRLARFYLQNTSSIGK
ncbi:hypothetical protein [Lapidilactobacillus luobeiensis]|uniref:hypothetical protein n=1 Tax=Lapidilactobacillus luobeiensis TaxID=2950371 RepID=UPI0021C40BCD|nr:hypothetical protein [Lapidilactobacillus luobeiensis]